MAASFKNVAVVGAGGNLGPCIVTALLKAHFNVSVITRSTSTSTFPEGVHVVKGDYSASFLEHAFTDIDAVVLTVGAAGLDEQKALIDAAAKAGVKRLVPSEFGSDTTNAALVAAVPYFQSKVAVIEYLQSVNAKEPKFTWTALITGGFYDWLLKLGFFGFNLATHHATLYDQGVNKFSATTLPTIGSAVAAILSHPGENANQHLFVNSFTTSQAEIFEALKKADPKAEWTVEEKSADAYIKGGQEKAANGDLMGSTYDLIFGTTFAGGYGADFSAKVSNKALGLEQEDVDSVTKEVYEELVGTQ